MLYCSCRQWIDWAAYDTGIWGYLHAHGFRYDGPCFKFCPFCGNELENDEPPEEQK
jgi:hypothetical protein